MSDFIQQSELILASGSKNRRKLLEEIGLSFAVMPSQVDEGAIKKSFSGNDPKYLALNLATHKAMAVSKKNENIPVIGADQLSVLKNQMYDKPLSHPNAIRQLTQLSGQSHTLYTAVCIAQNNTVLWTHVEMTQLKMRALSRDQIEHYLLTDQPYHSCGSYHFEGLGKWLFESVTSCESTIVGLPMLPLINALLNLKLVQIN